MDEMFYTLELAEIQGRGHNTIVLRRGSILFSAATQALRIGLIEGTATDAFVVVERITGRGQTVLEALIVGVFDECQIDEHFDEVRILEYRPAI